MTETMLALGDYRFSMDTAAYNKLVRDYEFNWSSQSRIGRRPALQFVGLGDEIITLSGVIYPHFRGGLEQITAMVIEAGKGEPLPLVDGRGRFWGDFVITKIKQGEESFDSDGSAYRQTFTLGLKAYGEDRS